MPDVVIYTSGHGFGHAVRDAELLRAIQRLAPELRLEVRTSAPEWLFPDGVDRVERRIDVGVVQTDSYRMRIGETLARYSEMVAGEQDLISAEVADIRAGGARVIVADIPAAAFPIARQAEIPGVGLGNFSWDGIYGAYVETRPAYTWLIDHLRRQYGQADLLLRLPLHSGLGSFARLVDVPLIARVSQADPSATRRRLGLPREATLVLLSFGGFAFDGIDVSRLKTMTELAFVITPAAGKSEPDGNVFTLSQDDFEYVDLLAACDVVVTKPGYGIAADCLANRVPMLYSVRGNFREEPALARGIRAMGRAVSLPRWALRRWDLRPYITRLLEMQKPWSDIRLDGADVAARKILELM